MKVGMMVCGLLLVAMSFFMLYSYQPEIMAFLVMGAGIFMLMHSKKEVKPGWIITDDGYIEPRSYVAVKTVEAAYRTPGQMRHALYNSSKAKARMETSAGMPAFRDQIILESLKDLCNNLFGKKQIEVLTQEEQSELLKQIKWRFSADIKQICRVTGIPQEKAVTMLDSL